MDVIGRSFALGDVRNRICFEEGVKRAKPKAVVKRATLVGSENCDRPGFAPVSLTGAHG